MSKPLLFMTGNERKVREAQTVCDEYGITLEMMDNDIDEIQHSDPAEVAKAKGHAAYAAVQQPLVVQDTSWTIPALGGFPGAYMKDVATWLVAEDWLQIMARHEDRTIYVHEHLVYHDGTGIHHFFASYPAQFIHELRGKGVGLSSDQVVVLDGSDETLAEMLDRAAVSHRLDHWREFAKWYAAQEK